MDETHGDLPERERPDNEGRRLTPREQETAGELRLLDPQLAGLFEHGIGLAGDIEMDGAAFLLAFIGRELSRGVLRRVLEDEGLSISDQDLEQVPKEERNRASVAKALHLPPDDPRVDDWFRLPGLFASWEKYENEPPSPAEVRTAFQRLSSLLFGRVAPYYTTEAELDVLLEIEAPTPEHAHQLRDLQLRPAQRNYFFGRLENAAWVKHLTVEGFFRNPPGRKENADGSWSARPWPEGHYLGRAAKAASVDVAAVLESIPESNGNPVVWDLVAKAACQLPADLAVRVVPSLTEALKSIPVGFFTESVVELAVALAIAGRAEAFELVSHLLFVESPEAMGGREGLQYRSNTEWVLPRFGSHDQQALIDRLVPAMESLDPERTVKLLLSKIQRVQDLSESLNLTALWFLSASDSDRGPDRDDVVAMLVDSAVGVAQRLASKSPEEALRMMSVVDGHDGKFFVRIGYLVLAASGHQLQERLDEFLRSPEARDPNYPATELAALLRAQFQNTSPEARQEYAEALETGPGEQHMKATLDFSGITDPSETDLCDIVEPWQRRILTFFRGDIPDELRDLASRLGVLDVTPSHRDQQLAEVGSFSEAGYWGGDRTPVKAEELSTWTVGEIVAFLRDWKQDAESRLSFGLQSNLSIYGKEDPDGAIEVLSEVLEGEVEPVAIEGILNGLLEAVKTGTELDWTAGLAGVRMVVQRVAAVEVTGAAGLSQWRRVAGFASKLIREGCARDSISLELAAELWAFLHEAMTVPAVWQMANPHHDATLGAVFMAVNNDASGDLANAIISAALWDYRSRLPDTKDRSPETRAIARRPVQQKLVPLLDHCLLDVGPNAAVPRAVMGESLAHLHLLAPEWVEAHAADLFEGGLDDPATNPAWTAYVSRSGLYDTVFQALRLWYVKAAEGAPAWGTAAGDAGGVREVTKRFAVHLIISVLRGLLAPGDEDRLLEIACRNLSASDWGHAYWSVFRWWTDATEPVPDLIVERLVKLWEWRVSELEKDQGSPATVEEAKGLGWLLHTPYIKDKDVVRLSQATVLLAKGQLKLHGQWEHLLGLAKADPDGVFVIVEAVLLAEVRSDFPHVPVDDVRPILAHVLRAGGQEEQDRARRLIHKLGERGIRQLKDLLNDSGQAGSGK